MTQPIPEPELLNPDRVNRDAREHFTADDHRARGDMLSQALEDSCAYARQLWQTLDTQRTYLLQSLPPDPRTPGTHALGASPTGPDDEAGWHDWVGAFAATTSALCGPHGDSGFGLSEARQQAQLRRTAPEMQLLTRHPELQHDEPRLESTGTSSEQTAEQAPKKSATAKMIAGVLVGVLALRGLRPRRK